MQCKSRTNTLCCCGELQQDRQFQYSVAHDMFDSEASSPVPPICTLLVVSMCRVCHRQQVPVPAYELHFQTSANTANSGQSTSLSSARICPKGRCQQQGSCSQWHYTARAVKGLCSSVCGKHASTSALPVHVPLADDLLTRAGAAEATHSAHRRGIRKVSHDNRRSGCWFQSAVVAARL
jgi:hypothetical protein